MALAVDGSSPPVATINNAAGTQTATTASFTPPANSLLVVMGSCDALGGASPTLSVTDNLGTPLTYTQRVLANRGDTPAADGAAVIWTAPVVTSAPMTVSVTNNASTGQGDTALQVEVLTGGGTTPTVGTNGKTASATSGSAISTSYTATGTNSWGFSVVNDWNATGAMTAGTGCTAIGTPGTFAGNISYGFLRRTTADGVLSSTTTLAATLAGLSTAKHIAAVEILDVVSGPAWGTDLRRQPVQPWRQFKSTAELLSDPTVIPAAPVAPSFVPAVNVRRVTARRIPLRIGNSGTSVPEAQFFPPTARQKITRNRRKPPLSARGDISSPPFAQAAAPVNPAIVKTTTGRVPRFAKSRRGWVFAPVQTPAGADSQPVFVKAATGASGAASTSITATFGSATTAGNLLVLCLGGDKNDGALTATGWTEVYSLLSTSVSLYYWWKVSTGESSVTVTWATASPTGNNIWVGEYSDPNISGSTWQVSAQASHITDETTVTSWTSGTTGAASAAGIGIACDAIDSHDAASPTFSAGWTNRYLIAQSGVGDAGIYVGERLVSSGATAGATFSYTLGTADQNSGAVAVFSKVGAATAPAFVLGFLRVARRLPSRARGRAVLPVPAQVTLPTSPVIAQTTTGRGARLPLLGSRRGRSISTLPSADAPAASRPRVRPTVVPVWRPRSRTVNVALSQVSGVPGRRFLRGIFAVRTRLHVQTPIPTQAVAPSNPPVTQTTVVRGRLGGRALRRGKVANPTPAQQAAPQNPTITQTVFGRLRTVGRIQPKARVSTPTPAQVNPPFDPNLTKVRRFAPLARRRARSATPTQAQQAAVPNPPITATVFGRLRVVGRVTPRGKVANPTPAQHIPPQKISVRGRLGDRALRRRARSSATPTPAQQATQQNPAITATVFGRLRTVGRLRTRPKVSNPTPAQQSVQNPPITQSVGVRGRLGARALRRPGVVVPVRKQENPVYPVKPSRVLVFWGLKAPRRQLRGTPVPLQDSRPATTAPTGGLRGLRRLWVKVRRRGGPVVPAQITTLSGPVIVTDSRSTVTTSETSTDVASSTYSSVDAASSSYLSADTVGDDSSTGSDTVGNTYTSDDQAL